MFWSRNRLLLSPLQNLFRWAAHRPKTSLGLGLVVGFLGIWAGVNLWAFQQFRAAQTAWRDGHFRAARQHIDNCLSIWPQDVQVHVLAARIECLHGNYHGAGEHLHQCKRFGGMTADLQLEWVLLRAQAGELPELEKGLWRCLKENHPQSPLILETLVRCYIREYRFGMAHRCLDLWLAKEPDNVRALDWRGWVRERLSATEGAYQDYRRVLERDPERWTVRLRLTQLCLADKDLQQAGQQLAVLQRSQANHPDVILALIQYRWLQGRLSEARNLADTLLAQNPNHPWALYYLGKLETHLDKAEEWLRRAAKEDPTLLEAQFALYQNLQQQPGRRQEAQAQFAKYQQRQAEMEHFKKVWDNLQVLPRNADLLVEAGESALRLGNEIRGKDFFYQALEIEPAHPKAHQNLAAYYKEKNQTEKAARHRELAAKKTFSFFKN